MEIVFNKKNNNNNIPLRRTRCNISLKRIVRKKLYVIVIIPRRQQMCHRVTDVDATNGNNVRKRRCMGLSEEQLRISK